MKLLILYMMKLKKCNQNTTDFTTVGQNNADTILQPENK